MFVRSGEITTILFRFDHQTYKMNLSLEGKWALICGSTQGIGLAVAEQLAMLGANCILMARNEDSLKEAIAKLDISNRQLHAYHVADFSKPDEVRRGINEIVAARPIHILINNTGGPAAGPVFEAKEEEFIKAFNQHLVCNHILAKAVVPGMKEAEFGRIINIISTSVRIPHKNLGVSNTIRGAVASWAKTLSNELGEFNITVNSILPGYTTTARLQAVIDNNAERRNVDKESVEKEMMESIPMKRFGDPQEIAAVVAFIASPAASYVNGVSIPVDGGRTGTI